MNRLGAGVIAGGVAGLVMAMAMMGDMKWQGQNVWTNPNLIAAMWMGPKVADGRLTLATLVGFMTHMATSAVMGIITIPSSIKCRLGLRCWRP